MDNRIRRNEICVIGLPRCDFVFSSTRTCFVAYGFKESPLEMFLLRKLLEERNIQPVEAAGSLAPGQSAFCAKICSKIITSQFCVVLINNDVVNGIETPNANVNMEYGLMLGFNKYIIPFQKASQSLPFNVADLDTVKYQDTDFERLATTAIDQTIASTLQDSYKPVGLDQILEVFLLMKKAVITPLIAPSDQRLYQTGAPLGFNLLNDFSGFSYIFLGNFTALRPEVILWRLKLLTEIFDARRKAIQAQYACGRINEQERHSEDEFVSRLQIWVVISSEDDKNKVEAILRESPLGYSTEIFSMTDIQSELEQLAMPSA
jgi:hypothetical protein